MMGAFFNSLGKGLFPNRAQGKRIARPPKIGKPCIGRPLQLSRRAVGRVGLENGGFLGKQGYPSAIFSKYFSK
jgi:hypothetical protein